MADFLSKSNTISSSSWSAAVSSSSSPASRCDSGQQSIRICVLGKNRRSQAVRSQVSTRGGGFYGKRVVVQGSESRGRRSHLRRASIRAQSGRIGNAQRWWEKGLQPNMKEVTSAQDLVDSLLNAGDKLVIVDFFSPGCGGCKALHPKICQIAEANPEVQFLHVNYEEHKSMCYSLNVHVLPFFRFYRGSQGRLCSFSCTNATIKKFRDALAKHSPDRCSLGPVKGLEEKELVALAANKDLNFNTQKKVHPKPAVSLPPPPLPSSPSRPLPSSPLPVEEKTLVPSGR
ncbi:Thioredoxin-like 1-1, chloroplastic [Linum grandiflorum]